MNNTMLELKFEKGEVKLRNISFHPAMVRQYVLSVVSYLLEKPAAIEIVIEEYDLIDLMFLVAMYYENHKTLEGFDFPSGYECPDFEAMFYTDSADMQDAYHIAVGCDEETDHELVMGVIAGILMGMTLPDLALLHLLVHQEIVQYIDEAYGGENDESGDFNYS